MEDYLSFSCPPFLTLKNWKSSLAVCQIRWHLPTSLARYAFCGNRWWGGATCSYSFFSTAGIDYSPIKGYFGPVVRAPYGQISSQLVPCGCSFGWITWRPILAACSKMQRSKIGGLMCCMSVGSHALGQRFCGSCGFD